jgi:MFS family permease
MIIKRFQPARYIGGLCIAWGMVATFSAWVENFAGLVACRLLLGFFEAGMVASRVPDFNSYGTYHVIGFFPGIILYMSTFYNRGQIGLRVGYFFCMSVCILQGRRAARCLEP